MVSIYIINYVKDGKKQPIAILEERILVDAFMSSNPWHMSPMGIPYMDFEAKHYKKDPVGTLEFVAKIDYSHLAPPSRPPWRPHSGPPTSRITAYSVKLGSLISMKNK